MLSLIAAVAKNNCIGINGSLPWHLPEDLQHFKNMTSGKTVLMGRKTWESLPEKFRPLPQRTNVVVTRTAGYAVPEGVGLFHSLDDALTAHEDDALVVIGGGQLYEQTIDRADTLYITHVDQVVDGDAFFPAIDPLTWKEIHREDHAGYAFVTYARI